MNINDLSVNFEELALDKASAVKGGKALILYNAQKFGGLPIVNTNTSIRNVGESANDLTTSAIVTRGTWLLCTAQDYKGTCRRVGVGRYPNLFFDVGLPNDSLTSVKRIA